MLSSYRARGGSRRSVRQKGQMPYGGRSLALEGVITLTIGLPFIAVGTEGLAAFNSCVADPACLPDAAAPNVGAFFAVLAGGIGLAVAGVWILAAYSPRSLTSVWAIQSDSS